MLHKVGMVNMVMEPIAGAFGGKKGKAKAAARRREIAKRERGKSPLTPEQKEQGLLSSIGNVGLSVHNVRK